MKVKTKNKNNIYIVNNIGRNQDLFPSKLKHDFCIYTTSHFYILID